MQNQHRRARKFLSSCLLDSDLDKDPCGSVLIYSIRKKSGAGAPEHATPLNSKLRPWGYWGWVEESSRLYGTKNHCLLMKTFCLAHV